MSFYHFGCFQLLQIGALLWVTSRWQPAIIVLWAYFPSPQSAFSQTILMQSMSKTFREMASRGKGVDFPGCSRQSQYVTFVSLPKPPNVVVTYTKVADPKAPPLLLWCHSKVAARAYCWQCNRLFQMLWILSIGRMQPFKPLPLLSWVALRDEREIKRNGIPPLLNDPAHLSAGKWMQWKTSLPNNYLMSDTKPAARGKRIWWGQC